MPWVVYSGTEQPSPEGPPEGRAEIEAGTLACAGMELSGESWEQQGDLVFPFCSWSSDMGPGIVALNPL